MLFTVLSALFLVLGVTGVWTGARRLAAGRVLGAAVRGIGGAGALSMGVASLGVSVNLWSYHRLTAEEPVAQVSVTRLGPREFRLRLDTAEGGAREFRIDGDEWQLDARIIKWKPVLALLGQAPLFRLERLSGRYDSLELERTRPRTVYGLARDRGVDLWSLARSDRLPWVDAYYGSAAYVPLADGAEYQVSLGGTGLVVRPANEAAAASVASWN
ncbi:MAG: hypothetical protein PVF91_13845 [Chromatiales bacterium]|jgi:hypothetical protein